MCIIVQTQTHIFLNNRKLEFNGFEPLTVRLPFLIDMDFRNQRFHNLSLLLLIHDSVQLFKINQHFVDIVSGEFFCFYCHFLCSGFNQQILRILYLIIHLIKAIIKVCLALDVVFIVRVERINLINQTGLCAVALTELFFKLYNLLLNGRCIYLHIIPDEIAQVLLPVQRNRFVMTQYPLPFKTAEMLEQLLRRSYPEDPDKDNLAGYSTTVHTTEVNRIIALNFILKASLIYGAIVLMVMCLTVLALQQLLDAEKNNYRFSVLQKMGVEEKDLHTLVLKQLGVWFGMPITAAIVVAIIVIGYFLQSVSAEISAYIGCGALMRQIGIIVGIFALLLSCYFLSTWLLFQRSIRSNSDSVR